MDVKENQVAPSCPKCNSMSVEKVDNDNEGVQGFFGFYGRGHLDKDFICKDCEYTW
ncbi:hypothetical protein HYG86_13290 [Alkalicella caledoniensis]|uniref:Uncharacterized protein n=1 Tax=Alkalicella caledoniensis TaxID=2731377 RepID=A0A7G9WAG9_ALKCA|nr:hypothetical protein [Alkalicella caledoniensis]QNO15681.1 hypothetical protein HYG86_13290 [Alkalicella caledoniensis]